MRFRSPFFHSLVLLVVALTFLGGALHLAPACLADLGTGSASNRQQSSILSELPRPSQWINPKLDPVATHSYRFFLKAGDYAHLILEQQGLTIGATLYGADGSILVNAVGTDYQLIPLSVIAKTAGEYRVEIRSLEAQQSSGRYGLKLETIRPSIASDEPRLIAEQSVMEGGTLLRQWKEDSIKAALDKFSASLVSWRKARDPRGETDALKRIGDIHRVLGQFETAQTSYQDALAINIRLGDRRAQDRDLNALCWAALLLGDNQKALKYAGRALKTSKELGD